jgi:hypothetical protein
MVIDEKVVPNKKTKSEISLVIQSSEETIARMIDDR